MPGNRVGSWLLVAMWVACSSADDPPPGTAGGGDGGGGSGGGSSRGGAGRASTDGPAGGRGGAARQGGGGSAPVGNGQGGAAGEAGGGPAAGGGGGSTGGAGSGGSSAGGNDRADAGEDARPPVASESVDVVRSCTVPAAPPLSELNLATNVVYKRINGQDLGLDVAWPKTAGKHPLVFMIHGGGWYMGDRTLDDPPALVLSGKGYVTASIDYRLATDTSNHFPAAIEDVRCALSWLRANAATYAIDTNRVVVWGDSAGGHLGSMLAAESDVAGLDGTCSVPISAKVNAVVAFYPPEDLRRSSDWNDWPRGVLKKFLGGTPEDLPALAALGSPILHVDGGDAPFLMLHSDDDDTVPIDQSRSMKTALRAKGVPATLVEVQGAGHAFEQISSKPNLQVTTCTALAFVDKYLKN